VKAGEYDESVVKRRCEGECRPGTQVLTRGSGQEVQGWVQLRSWEEVGEKNGCMFAERHVLVQGFGPTRVTRKRYPSHRIWEESDLALRGKKIKH